MKPITRWCMFGFLVLAACSNDRQTGPTGDTTPPEAIRDLEVQTLRPEAVTLRWTAPGDDGPEGTAAQYDIRYAAVPLTPANWDSATPSSRIIVPGPSGDVDRCSLNRMRPGTWYFGVRSADEVPNWSGLSNVVTADVPPVLVSLPVTDLDVDSVGPGSVTLSWTAPGDGIQQVRAAEYDLRYAQVEITAATWDSASRVLGLPAPATYGTPESFTVIGLGPNATYYLAIRSVPGVGKLVAAVQRGSRDDFRRFLSSVYQQ